MGIVEDLLETLHSRNPGEVEFLRAAKEVLESVAPVIQENPEYAESGVLERLVEPERQIVFRVPWQDDKGRVHVNRGFRIEFNSALGPYKGGLHFHPSVCASILKFLAFERCPSSPHHPANGGRQGRLGLRPQGKSDNEVMRLPVVHDGALSAPWPEHGRSGRRYWGGRP